ncbi:MAG: phosphoribosylglycinamide formyltransferase [Elusimicrobiota bacterium]
MEKIKIGVLVSGGGTNLQAIIEAVEAGKIPDSKIALVISNREDVFALQRARQHEIEAITIKSKGVPCEEYSKKISEELEKREVNLVCLAGFLLKLSSEFVQRFKGRILNVHPALLPAFGGQGMYGHHLHEAVVASGAKFSGTTVHFVDESYDTGPIILQAVVPVLDDDTPETLAARILKEEHRIYPEAIKLFAEGKLLVEGRRVRIKRG